MNIFKKKSLNALLKNIKADRSFIFAEFVEDHVKINPFWEKE